jgi:predicted amidohydrolase
MAPSAAPTRPTLRVAAVQSAPVAYDLNKSLHKLRSLTFAARESGAELVVFPEVSWAKKAESEKEMAILGEHERQGHNC